MASSKNIGDQLVDAVQSAVNSQDFSALQSNIDRTIGVAAENIAKVLASASDGIQRGQEQYARALAAKKREEQMALVYANPSDLRSPGVALTGWGIVLGASGLIAIVSAAALTSIAPIVGGAACVAAGAGLMVAGKKKLSLAEAFERYRDFIGLRQFCYIKELAASTADTEDNVRKNVKAMLSKGMFKQAALGDGENFLAMTSDAYREYQQARGEALQRQKQESLAHSTAADGQPLSPEAQALLQRGEAYIAQIRESNQAIPDAEITRKIDQIEHVVRTIFDRAAERPEVIGDLDHLMDYYLPTTVKLLDAYRDLDSQPIQSETIQKSKTEIEGALDSLNVAFEKLLDSVFREMAIDVSSDISVLHTVLAQEGLVESPFDANRPQKANQ